MNRRQRDKKMKKLVKALSWRDLYGFDFSDVNSGKRLNIFDLPKVTKALDRIIGAMNLTTYASEDLALNVPMNTPRPLTSHILCPTCSAIVGQKDPDGTILTHWEHNGPCGAPCAGIKYKGGRKRRKAFDHLHTKHACPRCAPIDCPVCKNVCKCPKCGGKGLTSDTCALCVPFWVNNDHLFKCKHNCVRCGHTGKISGLEAL